MDKETLLRICNKLEVEVSFRDLPVLSCLWEFEGCYYLYLSDKLSDKQATEAAQYEIYHNAELRARAEGKDPPGWPWRTGRETDSGAKHVDTPDEG